jgi:hypothetical protein
MKHEIDFDYDLPTTGGFGNDLTRSYAFCLGEDMKGDDVVCSTEYVVF